MARNSLVHVRMIEGSPITAGEVTLIPQVQFVTLGLCRGRITAAGCGAWGWARGWLIPRAVIEWRGGRQRHIPIPLRTDQALVAMGVVALAVALAAMVVERLGQRYWPSKRGD